jgi:hypothetical protein
MFETLHEQVEVLTVFTGSGMRPLRFRRRGGVVPIRRVTGDWTRREGQALLRCFSVEGHAGESYELCFDPRSARWFLTRAWSGGGGPGG